ncbi:MAG TPA: hypothetical protein VGJ86_09990 [Acidimicrobiales bacterium]|jgi:ribulose bisphosphate carboxylase small subunit
MGDDLVSASSQTFTEIQGMQTKIDEIEGQITALIAQGQKIAYETNWAGSDADRWRADWESETSPKLKTTLDVLRSINANAKDSASRIFTAGGNLNFG